MRIKQNPIVKGLAALMVIIPIYFLATDSKEESDVQTSPKASEKGTGKPVQTENEAIAAMSAYLSTVEGEQKRIKESLDNAVTKDDLQQIIDSSKNNTGDSVDEEALLDKVSRLIDDRTKAIKEKFIAENTVNPNSVGNVDNEMPFADAFEVNTGSSSQGKNKNSEEIQWAYPVGFTPDEGNGVIDGLLGNGSAFSRKAGNFADNVKDSAAEAKAKLEEELKPIPYATIHSDSSIHNATALTALIGRIERKGQTHDPFSFQVMLSGDTLMANGHTMPGVANAIVSGVGTGDMAFSCVRGRVTSVTFNFEDGRIYNQKGTYEKPIAELGDRWGNPCIKGVQVDDVGKYITAQGVVAGLSNYAETIAKQQQTLTSSGNSTSIGLTGNAGKLAAGSFASGGLNKTGEMLSERYENYYEAIYVPPGEKVSLLFVEDVPIDYIPTNRKVSYEENYSPITALD